MMITPAHIDWDDVELEPRPKADDIAPSTERVVPKRTRRWRR